MHVEGPRYACHAVVPWWRDERRQIVAVCYSVIIGKYADAISRRPVDYGRQVSRVPPYFTSPRARFYAFTHNRIHPFNFLSIVIARILQLQETRQSRRMPDTC